MSNESFNKSHALDQEGAVEMRDNRESESPERINRLVVTHPSGNLTAVVFDDVLDAPRKKLDEAIKEAWQAQRPDQPEIEQCCFVTSPKNSKAIARMEMFGGEFCGNATRSVVQLLAGDNDKEGYIEASGTDSLLGFSVKGDIIAIDMPLPAMRDSLTEQVAEGVLVHLDGITHLVVTDSEIQKQNAHMELLEEMLAENRYDAARSPAFGITYYDQATAEAKFAVWVSAVESGFDETACGSGTCSIGVAAASATQKDIVMEVIQPTGETISTETRFLDGEIKSSRIAGTVSTLYDGAFGL